MTKQQFVEKIRHCAEYVEMLRCKEFPDHMGLSFYHDPSRGVPILGNGVDVTMHDLTGQDATKFHPSPEPQHIVTAK